MVKMVNSGYAGLVTMVNLRTPASPASPLENRLVAASIPEQEQKSTYGQRNCLPGGRLCFHNLNLK